MNLKTLTNQALDAKVISLAHKDKELLAETIVHIAEVERRKLYRQLNIKSLYEYLTGHAGFANGSAYRLMDAARLQLEVPELAAKIEAGEINMTQVRLVQEASRQREKEERMQKESSVQGMLLEFSLSKPVHDESTLNASTNAFFSESISANISVGDFSSEITLLVGSTSTSSDQGTAEPSKAAILDSIQNLNTAESEKKVAQSFGLKVQKPLKVVRQKDGSVFVQMSFTAEQWAEIERAKEATSNSLPTGSYPEVISHLASKENERRSKPAKPHTTTKPLTPAKKKFVLQRDRCCQFHDPKSGKICGSRFQLQVDHIQPQWAGGSHDIKNLQVLCGAHNRMKYERESGIRRC